VTRRYFDNAATSFPKPPGVVDAVTHYLTQIGASAGRGAYREAMESRRLLDQCRAAVRRLFNCSPDDDVVFTLNGTDALNIALKGLLADGDHVVTTAMDHNSVLRPLSALHEQRGIKWDAVAADPQTTLVNPDDIRAALTPRTRLVVVNHASNVTGALQPLEPIAEICSAAGVLCVVDAAQSAGHVPIDFSRLVGLSAIATPGHKGLLGPLGTGLLVLRAELAAEMSTVREGGTGSASELAVQPMSMPDKFESGSHNAPGIAGLLAALDWLESRGIGSLRQHELELMSAAMSRLDAIDGLTWYGPRNVADRVSVFSVRIAEMDPHELSALLESGFGVLSRSGLHCAPLAHRTIGTDTLGGTTRLSFGAFTTESDVEAAMVALETIAASSRQEA